jgi:hypothetical protein
MSITNSKQDKKSVQLDDMENKQFQLFATLFHGGLDVSGIRKFVYAGHGIHLRHRFAVHIGDYLRHGYICPDLAQFLSVFALEVSKDWMNFFEQQKEKEKKEKEKQKKEKPVKQKV